MRPLRRAEMARDREEQADGRSEQVEIPGELGEACRPVLARDAERGVELFARAVAAAAPRLAEGRWVDRNSVPSPAGLAARLARAAALSCASASPASTSTCQG